MGNHQLLPCHEDLGQLRGWTKEQIGSAFKTLRQNSTVYCLNKDEYMRYFGGRGREGATVFRDLDTDVDGLVDIFEILVALTLWSGTTWEEKQHMFFEHVDMMEKGYLKVDEVMLLSTVMFRTLRKFIRLDAEVAKAAKMREFAQAAFPKNETKVNFEAFSRWFEQSELLQELKGYLEDHAARGQPDTKESRMQLELIGLERHAETLFDRIERLQGMLPGFVDACIEYVAAFGRRKRWDFLMQNMREVLLQLQQYSEAMHTNIAQLGGFLNEEETTGGLASVIKPHQRFRQEQMLIDLKTLRQQSKIQYRDAVSFLMRLIDLTEATESGPLTDGDGINVIQEDEGERLLDLAPPRVAETRNAMKLLHEQMCEDIKEDAIFGHSKEDVLALEAAAAREQDGEEEGPFPEKPEQAQLSDKEADGADTRNAVRGVPTGVSLDGDEPTLIAVADLEPPASHAAQMLHLKVGDLVTVLGQDGRGWWYGRKVNGKQGWFPPSYVQVKPAHFSSSGTGVKSL